jgi:hypothetical protein
MEFTPQHGQETVPVVTDKAGHVFSIEQAKAILARNPDVSALAQIPEDLHLPAVLDYTKDQLSAGDTIPFAEAHKIKRLLDDTINWNATTKKIKAQMTEGFRGTLRSQMRVHEPYNEANAAYGPVAKLYTEGEYPALHRGIIEDPSQLVRNIDWKNPDSIRLVHDLTVNVPKQGEAAGAQQGEAAFEAVRGAWTNENLIAKGPAGMSRTVKEMEASNSGREFIQTMYGDQAWQTRWNNLKQLADAWDVARQKAKDFPASSIAEHASRDVRRDVAYTLLPGHGITKVGAVSRLITGPKVNDVIQWASHTPATTQFLIKHVLTGPDPGLAMADFYRWYKDSGGEPEKAMPSHQPTGGPPAPTTVRTSTSSTASTSAQP